MNWLDRLLAKAELQAIGLMSGTSADGLDVAHVNIRPTGEQQAEFTVKEFFTWSYPTEIKNLILNVAAPNGGNIEDVCRLNFFLGHLFSNILNDFLKKENITPRQIDFIGSHGQTVCHLPAKEMLHGIQFASTLQIGDPAVIANCTGILTVGDFRVADMALGGEGAPLVPIFDYLYFRQTGKNRLVLNIGGIANISYLPDQCSFDRVLAFDTGPGNVLIDSLTRHFFGEPFDRNGNLAQQGKIVKSLLAHLLADEYFTRWPPKSTGREKFAGPVLADILAVVAREKISPADVIATVTELTARTIYDASQNFLPVTGLIDELIVSGGGSDNQFLMTRLSSYFPQSRIVRSDDLGLISEAKEAICFAMLGYQTLAGFTANLPSVTGAARPTILGKICLPGISGDG